MGKKHTVEGGKKTAAAILEAADAILSEVGFEGMSMRAVAQRAGVNKALVFYHFGNKGQLLERVLDRYFHAHLAALEGTMLEDDADWSTRFHRMIDGYFSFIAENQRYPRLIQQQVASGGDPALIQRSLHPLFQWTERILSELTPKTGPLAARHFFLSFSGMVINYFTYGPALEGVWGGAGGDPLSREGIEERRAHVHWMLDTILGRLMEDET